MTKAFDDHGMPDDAYDYHKNKKTGKTYVSRSIISADRPGEMGTQAETGRRFRIASKVIDGSESHKFVQELGEHLIRVTEGGRQEVVAKFYEDDRGIFTLQIQRFKVHDGKPLKEHFSFHGDEVVQLIEFILNTKQVHLCDHEGLNVTDEQLRKLLVSPEQARTLISENHELIIEAVKSEVTTSDIVAIGYRKKQLERFRDLLEDANTNETVWQAFFEKNVWIFGYGLTYLFLSNLNERNLEQAVGGNDLWQRGKKSRRSAQITGSYRSTMLRRNQETFNGLGANASLSTGVLGAIGGTRRRSRSASRSTDYPRSRELGTCRVRYSGRPLA